MKRFALLLALLASSVVTAQAVDQASAGIRLQDEGTSQGQVTRLNCVGTAVACTRSGATGTVTISGGGGTAASTTLNPDGGVAATNVELGIWELDLEKAPLASPSFTGAVTSAGAVTVSSVASGSNAFVMADGNKLATGSAQLQFLGAGLTTAQNFTLSAGLLKLQGANNGIELTQGINGTSGQWFLSSSTTQPVGLRGNMADGASAVGAVINANQSLTNASALLLSLRNAGTQKASFDKDGSYQPAAATLRTCASGTEGLLSRDTAAGGTSGARTRLCLCTSDGAGTPAYAWQNLASAGVGTTTTCP